MRSLASTLVSSLWLALAASCTAGGDDPVLDPTLGEPDAAGFETSVRPEGVLAGTLLPSGGAPWSFGTAVALGPDVAVIGAPGWASEVPHRDRVYGEARPGGCPSC